MYMYMYVCMYVCMHACMHVCLSVCLSLCLHVCACLSVCMYVCMYICEISNKSIHIEPEGTQKKRRLNNTSHLLQPPQNLGLKYNLFISGAGMKVVFDLRGWSSFTCETSIPVNHVVHPYNIHSIHYYYKSLLCTNPHLRSSKFHIYNPFHASQKKTIFL